MKRILRLLLLYLLALAARPLVRRPRGSITSVLYLKPDHLGDLLLATPVLAALRQRCPEARVAALVGPWSALVLQRSPDVDVLLTCPFPGFERRAQGAGRRAQGAERSLGGLLAACGLRLATLVRPYRLLFRYALLLRSARYDL